MQCELYSTPLIIDSKLMHELDAFGYSYNGSHVNEEISSEYRKGNHRYLNG